MKQINGTIHTHTHTEANVMNIYESVRTTPKCKTRAKSQNIPTHTRRGRREKECESEYDKCKGDRYTQTVELKRRLPFVFTLEKLQKFLSFNYEKTWLRQRKRERVRKGER